MLLLQFVHGLNLQKEAHAWDEAHLNDSARALGRLFVLDVLLGNADRLPIKSLMWRGNPSNVLWSNPHSRNHVSGHCTPIDAIVARRPPKLLVQEIDQKEDSLLELALLDRQAAQQVLLEAVSCNSAGTAAVEADWVPSEPGWQARHREGSGKAENGTSISRTCSAVKAFHEGLRSALGHALRDLGLLEMVANVLRSWLDEFHADMNALCVKQRKSLKRLSETKQLQ